MGKLRNIPITNFTGNVLRVLDKTGEIVTVGKGKTPYALVLPLFTSGFKGELLIDEQHLQEWEMPGAVRQWLEKVIYGTE